MQSTKVLWKPIQTIENWRRWKHFSVLCRDRLALCASMHCLWKCPYDYKIASYGPATPPPPLQHSYKCPCDGTTLLALAWSSWIFWLLGQLFSPFFMVSFVTLWFVSYSFGTFSASFAVLCCSHQVGMSLNFELNVVGGICTRIMVWFPEMKCIWNVPFKLHVSGLYL